MIANLLGQLRADHGVVNINKRVVVEKDDMFTELKKLKELLDEDILTKEEYRLQKEKILSGKW